MKKLTGEEIRRTWIKFFESKGHKWLPGVGLIPQGDKSLLWVNAGVTGLKKYFDGSEVPPCRRIVNVQKSIRTNDIDNVGRTARHHTFFEMLGNFSIGDYFRKEVIAWAVEILTDPVNGFGMPLDKLYMTYNPDDKESFVYWQNNGVKPDHLIPLEGNYWQIGEGPCGPNTEVFFDRGEKYDPNHLGVKMLQEDMENDRYIEIWGIVFSQFNAVNGVERKDYKELPSKNIDTGAGLERIACILQETETNFETDLFMPIIKKVEELSGKKYETTERMPFKVIADHARCLTFALGDGASFSNEGRGYVLRRIVRRALRYGQKLGIEGSFMHKLVDVVVSSYSDFYPELVDKAERISKTIEKEEIKFLKVLDNGEVMLKEMIKGKKELDGESIFKLADTYGFPADITRDICLEEGITPDMDGYSKLMDEQKERARSARGEVQSFHRQSADLLSFKENSEFTYEEDELSSEVIGLFVDGERVDTLSEEGEIIVRKTPFYAEMGGQISDTGFVYGEGFEAKVTAVSKATNGQHLHHVDVIKGSLKEGDKVRLAVDKRRRRLIERNHSATHLLHAAISNVLGYHVEQKGSYVSDDYLRFDFSSDRKLSEEEIAKIEKEVNSLIVDALNEKTLELPIEEAKKLDAEMEFLDKYGETVRVVTFGDYSKEFCGGTHVKNAGEIGLFVIESEEAISSGIRRIQARTSLKAIEYLQEKASILKESEKLLSSTDKDIIGKISSQNSLISSLNKELVSAKDKIASYEAKSVECEDVNGISFLALCKEGASKNELLSLCDSLKSKHKDYLLILLGGEEGARPVVIMSGGKALEVAKAGMIIKSLAKTLLGGGGGRDEMASGQFKTRKGFEEATKLVKDSLL